MSECYLDSALMLNSSVILFYLFLQPRKAEEKKQWLYLI